MAAWYDTRRGHAEIYARRIGPDGGARGPELRLTAGPHDAYEPDVHALPNGDFIVGWYEKSGHGQYVPYVGRWNVEGVARWQHPLAGAGRNTVLVVDTGRIFAAWLVEEGGDRAGMWAGWWHEDGTVSVAARRVADASRTTTNLNAVPAPASTVGEPHVWVAFDAAIGARASELFAVDVSPREAVATRLTPDDGVASRYPDLGLSGDRMALTWFDTVGLNEDVRLSVGPVAWLAEAEGIAGSRVRAVTTTAGHSIGAYLAWSGPRVGLAWCDDTSGQFDVHFQAFGADGVALSAPHRLTDSVAASLIPAIEPWGDGFALAWNEYDAPSLGHGVTGHGQIVFLVVP